MGKFQKLTRKEVLDAIYNCGGIVLTVAKRLGIKDWYTAKHYIDKWEETKTAFKAEEESILDAAEGVVKKRITEGDTATAKWYLTKKGKDRGYSDDLASMLNDQPLKIEFDGQVTRDGMETSPDIEISDGKETEPAAE